MIEPEIQQEAEQIRSRMIWLVGVGGVVITALLVALAWALVVPPPTYRAAAPSPLRREVFERAAAGAGAYAAGARQLERTEWVDREARIVRIPIDRAIEAVAADPRLIGAAPPAISRDNTTAGAATSAGGALR
jgi:hypothetical protein